MKNILILAMFCLSPMAFAEEDMCIKQNGIIDTSIGSYKFKTVELCQMIYKRLKQCSDNNSVLYEQMKPRVECSDMLQAYIDTGTKNIEKVSDQ